MSFVTKIDNIFKKGVIGNVRKAQEDSHDMALKTPNGDIYVVCDGMGGHVGGAKASSLAVESIISYLKSEKYDDPYTALDGALQFANMQILGFASTHPDYKGMGTTACIVMMQNEGVYIAHVGDSRIYLYLGKEKKLHRITKDHSYVQTLVDAGVITDDEAEHHPNKNRILKALGVTPNLQPSFNDKRIPIKPVNGDVFLICSDGLSGMIPDRTIEKVLGQTGTLEEKGELLINLAMQGETVQPGGQDNCTLELIQIDNSPWKKRGEFKSYNPVKPGVVETGKSPRPTKKIIAIVLALIVVLGIIGVFVKNKLGNNNQNNSSSETQSINIDSLINVKNDSVKHWETEKAKLKNDLEKDPDTTKYMNKSRQMDSIIGRLIQEMDSLGKLSGKNEKR